MLKILERIAGSADTQGSILVTPSEDDVHRDLYANSNYEPATNIFSKCNAESRTQWHCLAGTLQRRLLLHHIAAAVVAPSPALSAGKTD
jgi:hypothetical protein